jgi:hypothetical protein
MTVSAQTTPSNEPEETVQEQGGYCPHTHNLGSDPSAEYWLEGVIGFKTVRMYLNRGGSGVVGLFYEPNGDWKPVLLGGMWKASGIDLSAGADGAAFDPGTLAPIGRLQGQLTDNVFLGLWTPKGGEQAEPIRLSVVPKTGCEGKGAWKRFDSQKWPFSFSYPASWHLVDEHDGPGDYIRLICPDPESMAYNNDVTVQEGVGQPTEESGLERTRDGWRPTECIGQGPEPCPSLKPIVRKGMKIYDLSDESWGVYCRNGGYVAAGAYVNHVVLLQNGWTRNIWGGEREPSAVVDRIEKSIRAHPAK